MFKIVRDNRKFDNTVGGMKNGQIGEDPDGNVFIRFANNAVCLNNIGHSYSNNASNVKLKIKLLPPGTQLILEVEEQDDESENG